MSRALDELGCKLWLSDAHPALAPLYRSIARGWTPPKAISADDYRAAKLLPDSDPMKALCGFAMSYAGKWFGGFDGPERRMYGTKRHIMKTDPCRAAFASLAWLRESQRVKGIFTADFFSVPVRDTAITIYCDPPYHGTTGYSMGPFDSVSFWKLCREWSRAGARVLVSERLCLVPHALRWTSRKRHEMNPELDYRDECLFEIVRGLRSAVWVRR